MKLGGDVDFPFIYRSINSSLASIAQAAGRCNREGRLQYGTLYLFDPIECKLKGELESIASSTRQILPDFDDPLDPAAIHAFFELHYWVQGKEHNWNKPDVMGCFPKERGGYAYDFETAAERFRLIENETQPIFVPYNKQASRLIEELRKQGPTRILLRRLQRYTVGVYEEIFKQLYANRDIEPTEDGHMILTNPSLYHAQLGLGIDRPGWREPERMIL